MAINPTLSHKSQHMDESKLEPPDAGCLLCNSINRHSVFILQQSPEIPLIIEQGAEQANIPVIDCNQETVRPQNDRISIHRAESLDNLEGLYRFVIASAVVEHYPHPGLLLKQLLQLVAYEGIFYSRTPYILPIMKLFGLFGIKVDFTYPGHIHDLGQAFWENYFLKERSGDFRILASTPSIVGTSFGKHFFRTVAAYTLKAPWYILGES